MSNMPKGRMCSLGAHRKYWKSSLATQAIWENYSTFHTENYKYITSVLKGGLSGGLDRSDLEGSS